MRVNCEKVVQAWREGRRNRSAESIWTDGEDIYSYQTCLVTRFSGGLILNRQRYSVTTTVHQNSLAAELNVKLSVTDAPFGISPEELRAIGVCG